MTNEQKEFITKIMGLFVKYGIRSVTTNDITQELGISKKTLYEHFKDKSEIVGYSLNLIYEEMARRFDEIRNKEQNAIESMLDIYALINQMMKATSPTLEYDLRKYYPELFKDVFSKFNECIYQIHMDNLDQGQREGIYRDVDKDIISRILSHRMQVGMLEIFSLAEFYSEKVHKELFLYHLFGICNEKGAALINSQIDRFTNNSIIK